MSMLSWLGAASVLALVACGGNDDDHATSKPQADAGPIETPPDGDASVPVVDAGPPVRTIVTRSPFGDLTTPKSYVLDGDFELSMTGNVVPAWYVVTAANQLGTPTFQTGGLCASGTLCLALEAGASLLTYDTVAPPNAKLTLSFRAKPSTGKCNDASAQFFLYDTQADGDQYEVAGKAADTPDASGWCTLSKDFETGAARGTAVLQITAKHAVVIDGVSLADAAAGNIDPLHRHVQVRRADPLKLRALDGLHRTIRTRERLTIPKPMAR